MLNSGYSEKLGDNFATSIYNFLDNLVQNPDQKILVSAGTPDYICKKCPAPMKAECTTYNPNKNLLHGSIFWDDSMSPSIQDKKVAEDAGLKVGNIYSVGEIIHATEKQTRDYKSSLENC